MTSPRLPVFARFQQQQSDTDTSDTPPVTLSLPVTMMSSQSDSQSSIPMSVIQDARLLPTIGSSEGEQFPLQPRDDVNRPPSFLPPPTQATPMGEITSASIENLAADVASQVSSFFSRTSLSSQEPSPSTVLSTANLADHLAEELARAVSQLVPTTSSSEQSLMPTPSTSSVASTTASGASLTTQSRHLQPQSMQSPSPSDTLAPLLMTSLQMPQSGNGIGNEMSVDAIGSGSGTGTGTGLELQLSESQIHRETPLLLGPRSETTPTLATPTSLSTASVVTSEAPLGSEATTELREDHSSAPSLSVTTSEDLTMQTLAASILSNQNASLSGPSSQPSNQQQQQQQQVGEVQQSQGAQAQASGSEQSHLPDIDPSFLAALPDSIRQEVLAQHEREQRRLRAQREGAMSTSISPEFLAALPLNIQEEVCINIDVHCTCMKHCIKHKYMYMYIYIIIIVHVKGLIGYCTLEKIYILFIVLLTVIYYS